MNSDIPPDVLTVHVAVMNRGKRAKDTEVAEMTLDLSSLRSGGGHHVRELRRRPAVLTKLPLHVPRGIKAGAQPRARKASGDRSCGTPRLCRVGGQ